MLTCWIYDVHVLHETKEIQLYLICFTDLLIAITRFTSTAIGLVSILVVPLWFKPAVVSVIDVWLSFRSRGYKLRSRALIGASSLNALVNWTVDDRQVWLPKLFSFSQSLFLWGRNSEMPSYLYQLQQNLASELRKWFCGWHHGNMKLFCAKLEFGGRIIAFFFFPPF